LLRLSQIVVMVMVVVAMVDDYHNLR